MKIETRTEDRRQMRGVRWDDRCNPQLNRPPYPKEPESLQEVVDRVHRFFEEMKNEDR